MILTNIILLSPLPQLYMIFSYYASVSTELAVFHSIVQRG